MKFLMKMLDVSVRFIEREGDYALHFFADFIRGNTKYTVHDVIDAPEKNMYFEQVVAKMEECKEGTLDC